MSFPELNYPIFYYGRTALKTVVCQVQFNPILRIGQEPPASFQDRVRASFPKVRQERIVEFRFQVGGVEDLPAPVSPPGTPVWRFKTEDDAWTGGLGVNFLALETTSYTHFADFERRFSVLHDALVAVYGTEHYTRVGLRYINVFHSREFPGSSSSMFNPHLLGPLADPQLGNCVSQSHQTLVLGDQDWTITIRHGRTEDQYSMDFDHATESRTSPSEILARLRSFNHRLYQVFRWAITDTLHTTMEPTPRE